MTLKSRGFSLVELMMTITLMTLLIATTTAVFKHTSQANIRLESLANLKTYGQRSVNAIRQHVTQSRVLYQNDTMGNGLWARLVFDAAHTPIGTTRLPAINEIGSLSPQLAGDATTPFVADDVGNALFFLESYGHVTVSGRWIDIYRPRAYYLAKSTSVNLGKRGYAYDVVEWVGKRYADYTELVGAPAGVYTELLAAGITEAWSGLATTSTTVVYTINNNATTTVQASPTLTSTAMLSATHLFGSTGDTHYAVAFNRANNFSVADNVPLFATASSSGDGFPNGFETQIVGPTGGRKIFIRLVQAAEGYAGLYSLSSTVLASARNY